MSFRSLAVKRGDSTSNLVPYICQSLQEEAAWLCHAPGSAPLPGVSRGREREECRTGTRSWQKGDGLSKFPATRQEKKAPNEVLILGRPRVWEAKMQVTTFHPWTSQQFARVSEQHFCHLDRQGKQARRSEAMSQRFRGRKIPWIPAPCSKPLVHATPCMGK